MVSYRDDLGSKGSVIGEDGDFDVGDVLIGWVRVSEFRFDEKRWNCGDCCYRWELVIIFFICYKVVSKMSYEYWWWSV